MPPACSFFGVFFININMVRMIVTLIFNPYKTNQFSLINFILHFKTKHFNQIKKIEKTLIQLK
ncbi:hypothetical protein BFN00_12800 [Acinetobacter sp. AR2-3]|nr:hypothetical protein BFN00_12800 [Acinetobacter sp. AR2-3]